MDNNTCMTFILINSLLPQVDVRMVEFLTLEQIDVTVLVNM